VADVGDEVPPHRLELPAFGYVVDDAHGAETLLADVQWHRSQQELAWGWPPDGQGLQDRLDPDTALRQLVDRGGDKLGAQERVRQSGRGAVAHDDVALLVAHHEEMRDGLERQAQPRRAALRLTARVLGAFLGPQGVSEPALQTAFVHLLSECPPSRQRWATLAITDVAEKSPGVPQVHVVGDVHIGRGPRLTRQYREASARMDAPGRREGVEAVAAQHGSTGRDPTCRTRG